MRLGVGDGIELRLEGSASSEALSVDSCPSRRRLDARLDGFSAPAVGVKLAVLDEASLLPRLSVAASVTLQDEGSGLIADLSPTLRLTASRSIGDDASIIANIATAWDGSSIVPAAAYTLSLAGALSESLAVYAGLFGDIALGSGAAHSADAGVSYTVSDALSAEIFGAIGLVDAAPEFYGGIGFAVGIR